MVVYLDSVIVIDAVEGLAPFRARRVALVAMTIGAGRPRTPAGRPAGADEFAIRRAGSLAEGRGGR